MSLKPDYNLDADELKFFSEMGWFATLAVLVASFSPLIVEVFG